MGVYVGVIGMGGDGHDQHGTPAADQAAWTPTPVGRLRDASVAQNDRTYALWIPLALLLGFFVVGPFAAIVSIWMWQAKKDSSIFIDDHGRETANFFITGMIVTFVAWVPLIGWLLGAIWYVVGFISLIRASVAASNGEYFRYPLTLRMLS